jgi:propionate CoA-transferase
LEGIRRPIARRAALELFPNAFVNIGYGMSDGVPLVAQQEDVVDRLIFMIEQGAIGGVPATGYNFGAMHNPSAIIDDGYQFDHFHGGGLDLSFLGLAQVDREGNVNLSRFGRQITGCGGAIDISQNAKKVVFCGSFAVKGQADIADGQVHVVDRGRYRKFVDQVQQVTYSGRFALQQGREALYVTERAVFQLTADGLLLKEIAPGVDLQRDVLDMMDFRPIIADPLPVIPRDVYADGPLGLAGRFPTEARP